MIVSYKNRFIFIHIPKAAGSSVRSALSKYDGFRWIRRVGGRVPVLRHHHRLINYSAYPHWPIIKAKALLPIDKYSQFTKFAFVRHPVDWHLSMFNYILHHEGSSAFSETYKEVYVHRSFPDYIAWRIDMGPVEQVIQLVDETGRMEVDWLGRVENLAHDFSDICSELGISAKLSHKNRTKYQEVHVDRATRSRIEQAYWRDFELLGYDSFGMSGGDFGYGVVSQELGEKAARFGGAYDPWKVYDLGNL